MRKTNGVLFLAAVVVLIGVGVDFAAPALVGGWTPIKNLNDPHVKEIAEFAVSEHNKQVKKELKLVGIEKGETQVVSGTNYRLVLDANDGAATRKYQAIVWEQVWLHKKTLTSFVPAEP